MSRAFVKEDQGDQPEQLPDRPLSQHPNYMTRAGHSAMALQLAMLEQQLAQCKGRDDLGQQARQPRLLRDIRYYRARLQAAIVIDAGATPPERVIFGCCATFTDEAGKPHRYRIVGEDEAAAEQQRISWRSPLAQALLGKQCGDLALWQKPSDPQEIEVLAIEA